MGTFDYHIIYGAHHITDRLRNWVFDICLYRSICCIALFVVHRIQTEKWGKINDIYKLQSVGKQCA